VCVALGNDERAATRWCNKQIPPSDTSSLGPGIIYSSFQDLKGKSARAPMLVHIATRAKRSRSGRSTDARCCGLSQFTVRDDRGQREAFVAVVAASQRSGAGDRGCAEGGSAKAPIESRKSRHLCMLETSNQMTEDAILLA
jgi:hypothetical protein